MKTKWTSENIASQAGRRVVITGANSGSGFQAALELARKGAKLILPARTQAKAEDAVSRISQQVPQARLYPEILDLAEQASIHAFVNRVIERFPGQSIDLLINNAGVMAPPKPFLSQDAAHGALPTLFAAVADEAVPGGYYGPDGIAELKGNPTAVRLAKRAMDPVAAQRLWSESELLTKVKFGALSEVV